jgi:hypothetical protein
VASGSAVGRFRNSEVLSLFSSDRSDYPLSDPRIIRIGGVQPSLLAFVCSYLNLPVSRHVKSTILTREVIYRSPKASLIHLAPQGVLKRIFCRIFFFQSILSLVGQHDWLNINKSPFM